MIEPRTAIKKMKPYIPPTSERRGKLRLDFNENSIGPSPKVLEKLKQITREDIAIYPEYSLLKQKISNYLNIEKEEVLPTNGTDEAIMLVINSFVNKGDEVIIPTPTFAIFNFYASQAEASIKKLLYNEDLSFPVNNVLQAITKNTKLIVLVNPNNPTGSIIFEKDIEEILKKAKKNNAIVLIDEAYYEFYGKSSISLIKKYYNLIILRTFSKAFGIAGLRLGVIVSNKNFIKILSKAISPYSVNNLAVILGIEALNDTKYVKKYVDEVNKSKEILLKEFDRCNIKIYSSEANFFVAKLGENAQEIYEKLKQRGILIRDRTDYPLLKGCLRIGIGTKKQTKYFLTEFRKVLKEMNISCSGKLPRSMKSSLSEKSSTALILDMDGVLVDVSNSYMIAIQKTVALFSNRELTSDQIQEYKNRPGMNNDWDCTESILQEGGINVPKEKIINVFQSFYLGEYNPEEKYFLRKNDYNYNGLIKNEIWLIDISVLKKLSKKYKLGIVTGRPKKEALFALNKAGAANYFASIITNDNIPQGKGKPDPYTLKLCLKQLNAEKGYYFGDTPDDMKAAKAAGIIPI